MRWNWKQADWTAFSYDTRSLDGLVRQFLLQSSEFLGVFRHVGADGQNALQIMLISKMLISEEAIKTSEIEGEILNRDSVQSSLRHQFGLGPEDSHVPATERGIARLTELGGRRVFVLFLFAFCGAASFSKIPQVKIPKFGIFAHTISVSLAE
jgi:Domain of unknown function (DUF4172)